MSRSLVVVGAGIGGLSAAIHARLRGYDVLVIEQDDRPGGKAAGIRLGDREIDPGPSIVILPDIYRNILVRAGRNPDDYLQFSPLNPITRIFPEGHPPFDLPAGIEAAVKALAGIAPDDVAAFRALMSDLDAIDPFVRRTVFARPVRGWSDFLRPDFLRMGLRINQRQTFRQFVDARFGSPLLRAFLYGFPSYAGQTYDRPSLGALLIPYYMLAHGIWWPQGGVRAIPRALYRLAGELGVEFRFETPVMAVRRAGNRLAGVVTQGGEAVDADAFIANVDPVRFAQLWGRLVPPGGSFSYFTVHLRLREPHDALAMHNLLMPGDASTGYQALYRRREIPPSPILYLHAAQPDEVFAVVTVPAVGPGIDWPATADYLRAHVHARLSDLGIEARNALFERIQTPRYFERRHGNFRGSLYGPDEPYRMMGGMFPLANRDPEITNLRYAGGAVQPGAGMPMAALSGRFAAESLP